MKDSDPVIGMLREYGLTGRFDVNDVYYVYSITYHAFPFYDHDKRPVTEKAFLVNDGKTTKK